MAFALSACAYNYAGKEGKTRTEARKTQQDTAVVTLETQPEPAVVVEEPPKNEPASPCIVKTFDLYYFDASTQITRTLDCTTRQIVNVSRTPIGETTYQERREGGLPESKWYFMVDPSGTRGNYPNNDVLLKLSQMFKIEFYGREASKNLLVYVFLEDIG